MRYHVAIDYLRYISLFAALTEALIFNCLLLVFELLVKINSVFVIITFLLRLSSRYYPNDEIETLIETLFSMLFMICL